MRAAWRILTRSRMQFSLRGMMIAVAIAGLILCFLAWLSGWIFDFLAFLTWLLRPAPPGFAREVTIYAGTFSMLSASPAFWPTLCLGFALLAGIFVGFLTVVLFAAKAIRRRITRKA